MRIAILSDSHDQIGHLREAIAYCNADNVHLLLHCGDLISPFMLRELAVFHGPAHLVYGNNAGDQHLIATLCADRFPSLTHHGVFGALEADGQRIAIQHYPQLARSLAASGQFDMVCCGHNHVYSVTTINDTLCINPGELLGKDGQPTFAVYDTRTRKVRQITVGHQLV